MSRMTSPTAIPPKAPSEPDPAFLAALGEILAPDGGARLYAVLDGASIPDLLPNLQKSGAEYTCLYRGELEPDLAEAAPYLAHVIPGTPFFDYLLAGWGKHWGIFVTSFAEFRLLRKHFRTFLMVYDPNHKPMYFRYYDPRVFRVFLPSCTPQERTAMFGPVMEYLMESDEKQAAAKGAAVLRFRPTAGAPEVRPIRAVGVAAGTSTAARRGGY